MNALVYSYMGYTIRRELGGGRKWVVLDSLGRHQAMVKSRLAAFEWVDEFGDTPDPQRRTDRWSASRM